MDKTIPLFVIGLIFGGCLGFAGAASYGITLDGHDHGAHDQSAAAHTGQMEREHVHDSLLSLAPGPDAPSLVGNITPDLMSGWNLHIETTNFTFSPEHASLEHVVGEGHAHVYVNGDKIGRVYGPWFHIATLPKGENEIAVTLNSNDHRALAVGNVPLSVSIAIEN